MKIEIIEKNYDVGKRLRDLIEKKTLKLERYFSQDVNCKIVCKNDNKLFKMEVTITGKDAFYRAEVTGENMFENIDLALPKIERQIVKHSQKKKDLKRQTVPAETYEFLTEEPEEFNPLIKRRKVFNLDPITVEDAVVLLDTTDHDFYVFLNSETGKVNIVYKRKDGDVGLIEVNK